MLDVRRMLESWLAGLSALGSSKSHCFTCDRHHISIELSIHVRSVRCRLMNSVSSAVLHKPLSGNTGKGCDCAAQWD